MNRITRWLAVPAAGLMLAGLAAASASASAKPGAQAQPGMRPISQTATGNYTIKKSPYWAGYVDTTANSTETFKFVTVNFTVPAVNCTITPNSEDYQWAGTGGWSEAYLTASGIYEGCSGGSAYYEGAIWNGEIGSGPSGVLSVNPGDQMTVSVYINYTEYPYQATFKVVDTTQGTYYENTTGCEPYNYDCGYESAEVVSQGNLNSEGTADFGTAAFNTIKIATTTIPATKLDNANWTTYDVIEHGPVTGKADAEPGPVTDTKKPPESAFTNTWYRQN